MLDISGTVPYVSLWHSGGASATRIAPQSQIFDMEDR